MTLTIEVFEADNATPAAADDEHFIVPGQFRSAKGRHAPLGGAGELVLLRQIGGAPNPALALIEHQRLIRFTDDHDDPEATPFVWTMEIEAIVDVPLSDQEEAGETVTVAGRDWLTARMDKVHVLPDMGLDNSPWDPTRPFDYSATRLRDDDPDGPQGIWDFAVATDPDFDNPTPMHGRSKGYVDTLAEHLWSEDVSGGSVPGGDDYFRQRSEFPGGAVYFELGADDFAELKFDNVALLRIEKVYVGGSVHCIVDNVSEGEHLIAVKGTNANALKAFVKASWWTVSNGMPDELIGSLNEAECRNLPYPDDPPGFTPPEVIRLVVDEQQDIGRIPGVGFSFLAASDTANAEVTEVTDLNAKAPADTLLTLLKLLAASYLDIDCDYLGGGVDAEANPCDLLIHAWIRGTAGNDLSGSVIFEKGTARNISHEARSNEKATVALVSGNKFAPFQYPDSAPDGEIYEVSLDFGDASKATATRFAAEYVALVDEVGRSGITLDLVPTGPKPGDQFNVFDTVGVLESDGSIGGHRVTGIAFDLNADSIVRYSADLDQPSDLLEERLSTLMRRLMPGGAGFRVVTPSPVSPQAVQQKDGDEESHTWQWDGPLGEIQFYKNGTAITGASIDASDLTSPGDTKGKTLTGNDEGTTSRKYVAKVDKFQFNAGGGDLSPYWIPPEGRWAQEIRATVDEDGETIIITLTVYKQ